MARRTTADVRLLKGCRILADDERLARRRSRLRHSRNQRCRGRPVVVIATALGAGGHQRPTTCTTLPTPSTL